MEALHHRETPHRGPAVRRADPEQRRMEQPGKGRAELHPRGPEFCQLVLGSPVLLCLVHRAGVLEPCPANRRHPSRVLAEPPGYPLRIKPQASEAHGEGSREGAPGRQWLPVPSCHGLSFTSLVHPRGADPTPASPRGSGSFCPPSRALGGDSAAEEQA